MKLLQSSGAQDEEAKSRKKKKENRGLEKLYGKAGTGSKEIREIISLFFSYRR